MRTSGVMRRSAGSFNGAAAVRPRRCADRAGALARGEPFNGAAAVRPRRFETDNDVWAVLLTPSMGPRLLGRGDANAVCAVAIAAEPFNGAAAVRPRRFRPAPGRPSTATSPSMGPRLLGR